MKKKKNFLDVQTSHCTVRTDLAKD